VSRGAAQEDLSREDLQRAVRAYRRLMLDWGGLTRYGSENAELRLKPGEQRVVFLGTEITENWSEDGREFFPGKPYLNRGIARQTAAQMLVRFRQDVIALSPRAVVIEAGTNDIASVMGPSTEGAMADHYLSMLDLAAAHSIRVVLASVPPVCDCVPGAPKQSARRPAGKIISLNGWLRDQARKSGAVFLDYHGVLAEGRGLNSAYTSDGFLPNSAGYRQMAGAAERAIAEALAR